jgi:hypothetical protein
MKTKNLKKLGSPAIAMLLVIGVMLAAMPVMAQGEVEQTPEEETTPAPEGNATDGNVSITGTSTWWQYFSRQGTSTWSPTILGVPLNPVSTIDYGYAHRDVKWVEETWTGGGKFTLTHMDWYWDGSSSHYSNYGRTTGTYSYGLFDRGGALGAAQVYAETWPTYYAYSDGDTYVRVSNVNVVNLNGNGYGTVRGDMASWNFDYSGSTQLTGVGLIGSGRSIS